MKPVLFALFALLAAPRAQATLPVLELNAFYFNDSFIYSDDTKAATRLIWDVMVGLPLSKKGSWVLGWNYGALSFSDDAGDGATTLSISDMGPKVSWAMNRARTLVLGVNYNLITKGRYNPQGGTASDLRGTSLRAELGYLPQLGESLFLGAKLNYYKASFNEEVTGDTTLSHVTHSRTLIYPSIALTYRFD
jgi:hypothetical protein